MRRLSWPCHNLTISLVPQEQDMLIGSVKTSSVLDEPFISITPEYLPTWQRYLKRVCDILLSLVAIILLTPLYIFLIIGVKKSSPGPIFYRQERIGYMGKPFSIIKFRSMCENAEADGPMLSSQNDSRITPKPSMEQKVKEYIVETEAYFKKQARAREIKEDRPEVFFSNHLF